ncbi:MAG: hypothetical protein OEW77_00755 [Gemmatimonadota bacterium]|nr:hypothetical protein [Gemmatimonadota bacterium]
MTDPAPGAPAGTAPRSRVGLKVVALLMFFLGVNALAQAVRLALGFDTGPLLLTLWQVACGLLALLAAAGTWLGARWAAELIVVYGVFTGAMIASLRSMLAIDAEAGSGLLVAGAAAVAVCALLAWYVARAAGGIEADPNR